MTHGHSFWFWLVWACVIWYSTITIYVSVKGAFDIKQMLRDLKERGEKQDGGEADKTPPQSK
ncbi:MAG: hypothetical protein HY301_19005 [Verrucomicrobia bacterium]|nr:hypothetical protein [Verrucomicrobiota bacterium]